MRVCIELLAGPNKGAPTVEMLDKNIAAQERAMKGVSASDLNMLMDTKSILDAIRRQLTGEHF